MSHNTFDIICICPKNLWISYISTREIEINIIFDTFYMVWNCSPMEIYEKSFNQQEIGWLTCYSIIISYTKSNKNINKNKRKHIYVSILFYSPNICGILGFSIFSMQRHSILFSLVWISSNKLFHLVFDSPLERTVITFPKIGFELITSGRSISIYTNDT